MPALHGSTLQTAVGRDGTLAPIVSDPAAARMPAATAEILASLTARPGVTLAIVSGRSLSDLRTRVNTRAILSGNHGLEILAKVPRLPPAVAHVFILIGLSLKDVSE